MRDADLVIHSVADNEQKHARNAQARAGSLLSYVAAGSSGEAFVTTACREATNEQKTSCALTWIKPSVQSASYTQHVLRVIPSREAVQSNSDVSRQFSNQSRGNRMTQRITDLALSVLASVAAFLLSLPFWRDFEDWPESHVAWRIYFVLGFVLVAYVFYVFIGSLHIQFLHGKEEAAAPAAVTLGPVANKKRTLMSCGVGGGSCETRRRGFESGIWLMAMWVFGFMITFSLLSFNLTSVRVEGNPTPPYRLAGVGYTGSLLVTIGFVWRFLASLEARWSSRDATSFLPVLPAQA